MVYYIRIMANRMENKLIHIGLSPAEVRVYLASLESGPDTVMHLATKAGIKRPTCYVMIETLMRRGLMSSFIKGKKRYFSVASPEKLFDLVGAEKTEVAAKEVSLKEVLPELISLFNMSERKPQVRFFEGKEGIRAIQRDIVKSRPRQIYEFVPLDPAYALFPPAPGDHREKIMNIKGIKIKSIYTSKKRHILPRRPGTLEIKFVSSAHFPFSTEIVIYNEKVAFLSLEQEILGVIIEGKQIADTMRTVFELAWNGAS